MFHRILIANRGEIAMRLIRCCRELNIETVLVYSEADRDSLPVMTATRAVCIGPARAADSYLNQELLIETARNTGCDALHPGYGFLSENPEFAEKCVKAGLTFIGPSADIIRRLGDKQTAREMMKKAGVPIVPGSEGIVRDAFEAAGAAEKVGYPVLLKATAGGGGKGMREAYSREEIRDAFETASAEAQAAFGNGDLYVEKLIQNPHHIEFQILADSHGNVIHLGERDCSVQNHHQKVLEESPSWFLNEEKRHEMGEAAVRAAKAAGYDSAGTVEFIMDGDGSYYFIEMNTRIQVEHPVTEMICGMDLIREQIMAAAGRKLSRTRQDDVKLHGHAMEFRINAGSAGRITCLHLPGGYGVRVDTHLFEGYEVTPFYDSMLAKLIVTGETRMEAIRRMRRVLEETVIDGIETNLSFLYFLTYQPDFIRGTYDTAFYEKHAQEIQEQADKGMI